MEGTLNFPMPNCVIVCHGVISVELSSFGKQFGVCWLFCSVLIERIEITYQRGIPDTSFTCLHLTAALLQQQEKQTSEFQYDIQSRKMTSRLRQLVDNFTAGRLCMVIWIVEGVLLLLLGLLVSVSRQVPIMRIK